MNSDILMYGDDEVVGVRGNRKGPRGPGPRPDVERVNDLTAEKLADEFENFLDTYEPILPQQM